MLLGHDDLVIRLNLNVHGGIARIARQIMHSSRPAGADQFDLFHATKRSGATCGHDRLGDGHALAVGDCSGFVDARDHDCSHGGSALTAINGDEDRRTGVDLLVDVSLLNGLLKRGWLQPDGADAADVKQRDRAVIGYGIDIADLGDLVVWDATDGDGDAVTFFQRQFTCLSHDTCQAGQEEED